MDPWGRKISQFEPTRVGGDGKSKNRAEVRRMLNLTRDRERGVEGGTQGLEGKRKTGKGGREVSYDTKSSLHRGGQ